MPGPSGGGAYFPEGVTSLTFSASWGWAYLFDCFDEAEMILWKIAPFPGRLWWEAYRVEPVETSYSPR